MTPSETLIDRGARLHRLMENEDFALFLEEMDARIAACNSQLKISASGVNSLPHIASNYAQRFDELVSLREWIADEIDRGGREKMRHMTDEEIADAAR